ncbi:hypothetical protein ABEB36_005150 [Hypothenemus hampei]|uniref:Uncharacterized protein n=1 Tax=Hypothenemus hampei TaxID=57062 RepID=A0ABD1EX71_HYPHA
MNCLVLILVIFSLSAVRCQEVKTSEEVGDSFKLDERGPFWEKIGGGRLENGLRSIHSNSEFNENRNDDDQKLSLKDFLESLAKKYKKPSEEGLGEGLNHEESESKPSKDKSNKSTWTLLDVQRHKHPFEDRNGWVSLDPIPWSVSKISKWQSKYKPTSERPWDNYGPTTTQKPYTYDDEYNRPVSITPPSPYLYHRPTESSDRYDIYYDQGDRLRPTPPPNKYPRPTAYFGHKVHLQAQLPESTGRPYTYHNRKDCKHPNHPYDDIITDGRPSNFPQYNGYETFRRRGSEIDIQTDNSQLNGEGEWVLLSTTKGYKPPRNHQRALAVGSSSEPSQTIRASRGIRLMVLPPLKGSNVNMTTSHGGLLQVESTFESVEQAKQNFDKKQNVLKLKAKRKRRKSVKKNSNSQDSSQNVNEVAQYGDPGAVMAAVGAGMIPATMAMMVPIAMSG